MPGEKKAVYALIGLFAVLLYITAVMTDGTGDSGDSVMHYLFSRYAFDHPQNFLDHWAKPLFVLVSAPFAQFGFTGMKLFNCTVALLTAVFVFRVAASLGIRPAWVAPLLLFFSVEYAVLIFSGLTEPLFGLGLTLGVYCALSGRRLCSALVISFLPFVRSEGWIIMGVFALFFVWKKHWKMLPVLLAGHLVYTLAGFLSGKEILWVFIQNPYANGSSPYGSGSLLHYAGLLPYVLGVPVCLLFCFGLIRLIYLLFSGGHKRVALFTEELLLVYGCFFALFFAHSLFWWLGLFNSAGLSRVLLSVVPLAALIAARGFEGLSARLLRNDKAAVALRSLLLVYVMIFPFTPNPAAIDISRDLSRMPDQRLADELGAEIKARYTGRKHYYEHNYLSMALDIDPFDKALQEGLKRVREPGAVPPGSLIIWDDWYAPVQAGIMLEELRRDTAAYTEVWNKSREGRQLVLFTKN